MGSLAGGNQVVVLGGDKKIPAGIRGSGVLHRREQQFGVPAEREKLRHRWGRLTSPLWEALGPQHWPWGAKARSSCQLCPWALPHWWPWQLTVARVVLQWPQGLDPAGLQRSLLFPHPCPGSRRQDFVLVM